MNNIYLDEDIIWISVTKYELFMSYGKVGIDAYVLYSHLIYTARKQQTNSVWANNVYIRDGLNWTKQRVQRAKSLLFDLDLIEEKRDKNKKGQFTKCYIVVKTKKNPFEIQGISTGSKNRQVDKPPVEKPEGGNLTANALTNKEMLKQENKCFNKIQGNSENTSLHALIKNYFGENNREYTHSAKEAKHIKIIEKRCGDHGFSRFLEIAQKFKQLEHEKWWEEQPFIPSTISSLWERIIKAKIKSSKKTQEEIDREDREAGYYNKNWQDE